MDINSVLKYENTAPTRTTYNLSQKGECSRVGVPATLKSAVQGPIVETRWPSRLRPCSAHPNRPTRTLGNKTLLPSALFSHPATPRERPGLKNKPNPPHWKKTGEGNVCPYLRGRFQTILFLRYASQPDCPAERS